MTYIKCKGSEEAIMIIIMITRAFGDISSGITHQGRAADYSAGAHMLGDRVCLHFDDFPAYDKKY